MPLIFSNLLEHKNHPSTSEVLGCFCVAFLEEENHDKSTWLLIMENLTDSIIAFAYIIKILFFK